MALKRDEDRLGNIAFITLTRRIEETASDDELKDEIKREIEASPLGKKWIVEHVALMNNSVKVSSPV
jgi:hypothetical protein